jgi:hypothetical protein
MRCLRDGADRASVRVHAPWLPSGCLPWVEDGSGTAAIGANETVHHRLGPGRGMIPVDRRHDQNSLGSDPHGVDLVHPIVCLAERVSGIATAGPMAQRHRSLDAGFCRGGCSCPIRTKGRGFQPRPHFAKDGLGQFTSRQLFDISPGQVWSLRDEPLTIRMRGVASTSS